MRAFAIGLVIAATVASTAFASQDHEWPPANHSRHVASVVWTPSEPQRGQTVNVRATLQETDAVTGVLLRVCRVENYACRSPLPLAPTGAGGADYTVAVPWEPAFYRGVRTVGLAIVLQFENGTTEESPQRPWPAPASLPEGAGTYYFYTLPSEPAATPSWAAFGVLTAVVGALLVRRLVA